MPNRIFIDVREEYEYLMGHVKDAINLPFSKLSTSINNLMADIEKEAELVIYCRSGARASAAVELIKEQGYSSVVNGINQQECQRKYGA